MLKYLLFIFPCLLLFLSSCQPSFPPVEENLSEQIRVNQLGYYPDGAKKFFVIDENATTFYLVDEALEIVFTGEFGDVVYWELAEERARLGDFSDFTEPGTYRIYTRELGYSHPFEVKENLYRSAFLGALKGFYYQRMSTPLSQEHAGQWARPMAHPDTELQFHPSSGKTGGTYASPGGWYDAGDYNKYTVNGAFSTGQLLALYEQYPDLVGDDTNIPESGNGVSDLLDEIRYELEWLLTMQDEDGGCFHKITAKNFEGMVMPQEATSQRYVVGKGTAASLDFSACMAKASRAFREIDPEFANKCLQAAEDAWDWAIENPEVAYRNPEDIATGEYGDDDFEDEWFWAATELYVANESPASLGWLLGNPPFVRFQTGDGWKGFMGNMGVFTILGSTASLPNNYVQNLKQAVLTVANEVMQKIDRYPYRQPAARFQWGSNSDLMNAAMILAHAYRQTLDARYITGMQEITDYIFGKNATGYSFLTGFGDKTPMHIHHRQSEADGIEAPVPGLLAGGPNLSKQDAGEGVEYPRNAPAMKCYVDQVESYASNEICLNWNAPLVYVLGFLEANR